MNPNRWTTSTRCDHGACVDVGFVMSADLDQVLVRDSKHPDGPVIAYSPAEWAAIVDAATFARPGCIAYLPGGTAAWLGETDAGERVWLEFTLAEIDAWVAGVRAGEFRAVAA